MTSAPRFCLLTLIVSLAACSSPSVRYHTLVASSTEVPRPLHPAPFLISVLPVGIPAQLDQTQLVVRQGESDARVLNSDRWLSPLGEEIRTALSADLTQRLNTQDVSGLARRAENIPVIRVHLQVRRFDSWPGQFVKFDANWSLSALNGESRTQLLCTSQFTENARGGVTEMLLAQQKIIARLAAHIATNVNGGALDTKNACSR